MQLLRSAPLPKALWIASSVEALLWAVLRRRHGTGRLELWKQHKHVACFKEPEEKGELGVPDGTVLWVEIGVSGSLSQVRRLRPLRFRWKQHKLVAYFAEPEEKGELGVPERERQCSVSWNWGFRGAVVGKMDKTTKTLVKATETHLLALLFRWVRKFA